MINTRVLNVIPDGLHTLTISGALTQAAVIAERCARNAAAIDREGAFPVEEFAWIAEAGLLAAPLPHTLGGPGLGTEAGSTLALLLLLKQIGRGNLAVGRVYEGHINALQLIQTFGTAQQQTMYAADAHHHKLFGVWNTEAADGVKIFPVNGRYRLEGAKTFASGAGYVGRPMVNGVLPDGGWQMCIVPMDRVRVEIDPSWWQVSGMRASASYRVDFSGVELEPEELIGVPGDYYRQPWLTGGVIRFAAVQLGAAEALLDAARDYLQMRGWTGDPYQRARMAEAAIAVESGNLWLRGAALWADRLLEGDCVDPQAHVAYANMVRTAIEKVCLEVLGLVERSVGARGLLKPHPFERIGRDLTLYLRQPAPDAALADIGRHVLERTTPVSALWSDDGI